MPKTTQNFHEVVVIDSITICVHLTARLGVVHQILARIVFFLVVFFVRALGAGQRLGCNSHLYPSFRYVTRGRVLSSSR